VEKVYISMGFMAERLSGRLELSISYMEAFEEDINGICD
jgi:hypothetical protein